MKKTFTFLSSLFIAASVSAQSTTLTRTNYSVVIGFVLEFKVATAATASLVPLATSGAGVTWNCAGLVQNGSIPTVTFNTVNPSTTPYASSYPNANQTFTDPNLTSMTGYDYVNLSNDSLSFYGNRKPGQNYEIYMNPEILLKFPFAYTNSYVDNYAKNNYTSSGTFSSFQTGSRTVTYDAYGTLILPSGTYSNVARIKGYRTNSLGSPTTEYTFFRISDGARLLNVMDYMNGTYNTVYVSAIPSSVNEMSLTDKIRMYPNPSANLVELSTSSEAFASVMVNDITGKEIMHITNTGEHITLNFEGYDRGIYFVTCRFINGQIEVKKVVIQ